MKKKQDKYKDIYSKRLTVRFIQKIRDEKKFDNLGMLKLQIQKDISKAINILRNYQWQLIIEIH